MKHKEKIVRLLCQASTLLNTKDEQQALINFAINLGLIYGQAVQIDVTDLKPTGIIFGERGISEIVANADSICSTENSATPVAKSQRLFQNF